MEPVEQQEQSFEPTPVYDNVDIDLFVKVLANTALSPFFVFFIPVFYWFQGAKVTDPVIVLSAIYYVAISIFWFVKWTSKLYRNQGSLFFAPRDLEWSEQIVILTGGSSGIGELLANTLAVKNVTVVVLDIKPIETENYNIVYYKCDVSKWEEVQAVSKKVIEEVGEPTILINNAGVVQGKLIIDLTEADVQQTFGVNVLSNFWILKAFLPSLLKAKTGHIVTMASSMGLTGVAQMSDYCASKAALVNLHESLRYELDNRYNCPKIRTTLVCPGLVHTRMFNTVTLPTWPLFKFLAPSLQPITVVKQIITALDDQHSQTLLLPFYVNFIPYVQLLPSFLRDLAQKISGADYAMRDFVKVSGRRADEGPLPTKVEDEKAY